MIKFIGIAASDKEAYLYFAQTRNGKSTISVVKSHDGLEFSGETQEVFLGEQASTKLYDLQSARIVKQGQKYFLTYRTSRSRVLGAVSEDLIHWQETGPVDHIKETCAVVPDYSYRNQYIMYFGEKKIRVAHSAYLYQWKRLKNPVLSPRKKYFDEGDLEVGGSFLVDNQILLIYYVKKNVEGKIRYSAGAAFFDKDDPIEMILRSKEPLWEQPEELLSENIVPLGVALIHNELILYFVAHETNLLAISCPLPGKRIKEKVFSTLFKKAEKNPIIAPCADHPWESRATFNSAAIYEDGKVHFLYRALGDSDLSVLGYATSTDGINIDFRGSEPAYIPREPFETPRGNRFSSFAAHFASGGGYGGVEDPRLTRVENKLYLTYVAFDGATPPRAALSSINLDDFLNNKWNKWADPKLISAPGMVNKSAVVFPRKVRGKYVLMHRVYPHILVDYLDNLEFNDYLCGHYFIPPRRNFWDSKKVGAGAPPMETADGWLLIYQSVGHQEPHRYKIGAMMLDRNHPEKVLYRTSTPIIEPNEVYENDGFKAGVVYPCGAVTMNNNLHVYYGGADTVVCAASADLEKFLYEMKHDKKPTLQRVKTVLPN